MSVAGTAKVKCPKCGLDKKRSDFYEWSKQGGNPEGRSHHCRECEAQRQAAKPGRKAKRAASATRAKPRKPKPRRKAARRRGGK